MHSIYFPLSHTDTLGLIQGNHPDSMPNYALCRTYGSINSATVNQLGGRRIGPILYFPYALTDDLGLARSTSTPKFTCTDKYEVKDR